VTKKNKNRSCSSKKIVVRHRQRLSGRIRARVRWKKEEIRGSLGERGDREHGELGGGGGGGVLGRYLGHERQCLAAKESTARHDDKRRSSRFCQAGIDKSRAGNCANWKRKVIAKNHAPNITGHKWL